MNGPRSRSACAPVREALSAHLDGEDAELPALEVERHVAACSACAGFVGSIDGLHGRTRVASAAPVPDLTAPILARLARPADAADQRRTDQLRWLVGLAGFAQLVLALPALVGVAGPDVHAGRDLGALAAALAVGFIVAAVQPWRTAGMVPVAVVLAATVVITGIVDVVTGAASLTAELPHLTELVGVAALIALSSRAPVSPAAPSPRSDLAEGVS